MKIYTGCFRRRKHYPPNLFQVAICRWCPTHKGLWVRSLATPKDMPCTTCGKTWGEAYQRMILDDHSPKALVQSLAVHSRGRDVVLLCYEEPGAFCHRRFVAEWLEKHLDIVVPEYGFSRDVLPKAEDAPEDHYSLEHSHWEQQCSGCGRTQDVRLTDEKFKCNNCDAEHPITWE